MAFHSAWRSATFVVSSAAQTPTGTRTISIERAEYRVPRVAFTSPKWNYYTRLGERRSDAPERNKKWISSNDNYASSE